MVSDIDLAQGEALVPQGQAAPPRRIPSRSKRKLWVPLLLLANLISWTCVYGLWTGRHLPIVRLLAINRAMVTGIIYHEKNPCAIVRGRVAREGDTIDGYKVVRIHKDRVEFEKDGHSVIKWVYDP
jgi:hypothetical protein